MKQRSPLSRPSEISPAHRRGIRMAAQVAGALTLIGAAATAAHSQTPDGAISSSDNTSTSHESAQSAAELLRLGPMSGGCVPSWGPPAPPAFDPSEMASLMEALQS